MEKKRSSRDRNNIFRASRNRIHHYEDHQGDRLAVVVGFSSSMGTVGFSPRVYRHLCDLQARRYGVDKALTSEIFPFEEGEK